ncbi:division/cell wall cluster transcriptional repressor MraZ [Sphingomonas donggukensis]|uniref:Division/cell wall cluster transcriptional repressor MraZ n=1 Tax=Sphingomonas donggukensis TaxID=2949093 RepID=A0ABY4TX51_9SPHN|nr:division/cell wall cluster transcriptional repressor MraZ [Sphingomonas donggukensis]URW76927.1 division/cell wall cluster transcriptional repressor MraZ [Sphingomonas donggukensis]
MNDFELYEGSALQGVDAKGRVAIPADFRATFEKNSEARTIVIGIHPLLPCLRAYDLGWSKINFAQIQRDMQSPDADVRAIAQKRNADFSDVDRAPFDPSGRFVLDEFFRSEAQIETPGWAFFSGDAQTFNIWNPDVLMATTEGVSPVTRRRCAYLMANRKVRA